MSESPEESHVWDKLMDTFCQLLTLISVALWGISLGLLLVTVMMLFSLS